MPRLRASERTLSCVCAAALGFAPQVAGAQLPSQLAIDWDGPAACPKSERFDAELAQRLDPALERLDPQRVRVRVEALEGDRHLLTLTTQGASGPARRSVDLDSCEEVQRAAAVLIATALSPAAAQEFDGAPPADSQPWSLRLSGLFDASALPRPSGGPSLGLGHDRDRLRLWADARYVVGRESSQPELSRVRVDLFAVAIGGAYLWQVGPVALGPLLELELGALRGRASAAGDGSAAAPWVTPLAGGALELRLGPVALVAALALGVPLLRPEFEAQDPDNLYATRPVTGRAQLGLKIPLGRAEVDSKNLESSGQW